ncbi:hypothetical protein B0H16DRAFT_1474473 [Mycena metata]|uniref:Uncharacterized protein n=1 Tax=Mycena metata TaxID=1033252 RepID=A0AAD7HGS5_9AGAR|nr:hypothetical protein B0H16DRAFT_1474473 [Mycena metata]
MYLHKPDRGTSGHASTATTPRHATPRRKTGALTAVVQGILGESFKVNLDTPIGHTPGLPGFCSPSIKTFFQAIFLDISQVLALINSSVFKPLSKLPGDSAGVANLKATLHCGIDKCRLGTLKKNIKAGETKYLTDGLIPTKQHFSRLY